MSSQDSSAETQRFKEILKNNGIHDPVSEIIFNNSGLVGENFGSKTQAIVVKFVDPSKKPLQLFMKYLFDRDSHTKMITEAKAFEKEATFLSKYLPVARKVCRETGQEELMKLYPKCYYGDEKMILMENLVIDHAFCLLSKEEQQDFETAKLSLTSLAKHHALARAMVKNLGGPENFFKQFSNLDFEAFCQPSLRKMMEPTIEKSMRRNIDILEKNVIEGKEKALKFLKAYLGKAYDDMLDHIRNQPEDERLLVLNHGDYWNNNMMFKKNPNTGKVTEHVMLDFQITRYGSLCLDLSYFLYTSVTAEVRREKLMELLRVYLNVLEETSEKLECPIEFHFDELLRGYLRKVSFGFWFNIAIDSGLGFKAMKYINPEEIDMSDFGGVMEKVIQRYLEENPEEKVKIGAQFVALVQELEQLKAVQF